MSKFEKTLICVNLLVFLLLTLFSYAYVDLNLTLSRTKIFISFVNAVQQLGYYHRPQATLIYLILIIFTFSFFIFNLWLFYRNKVGLQYLKISTIVNTLVLIFAYPFLSSDLFNYLFDAKIILNYHSNPYTHRPLDFPNDEWLRFMRWTHRLSPYGPVWLGMSLIPASLGFGKFILNFLTFKIFISIFHLVNAYLIFKILKKINPKRAFFGTAFYALNPLFLIEGVVNAHNDVVLATLILATIYFLIVGKAWLSYLALLAGSLVKYIQILTLPWLIFVHLRGEKISHLGGVRKYVWGVLLIMAIFTYLFSSFRLTVPFVSSGATQVQFQPWYLFWTLPFVALLPNFSLIVISIGLSIGASLRYLPYLFYGDWTHPNTILFMQSVILIPLLLAGGSIAIRTIKRMT